MSTTHFSEEILSEVRAYRHSESLLNDREEIEGITIDGAGSLDLDDAINLEVTPEGFIIHVSIADVTDCVRPESQLFAEALRRAETRYLSVGNIPMLPRSISEEALSLVERQPRPAVTFSISLTRLLEVQNVEIRKTVIKNRRRLNYAQVDFIIDASPDDPDYQLLNDCYVLARRLMDMRRQRGALVIYDLQHLLRTNEEGQLIRIDANDAHKSNIIIQEFMVLTNAAVAELAAERGYVFLFRNHTVRQAAPDRKEILEQLGAALSNPQFIETLARRSALWFAKAQYEPVLKGHYGLNLPAYAHVTSPLRRAADLINHELLKAQWWNMPVSFSREQLESFAATLNTTLINAVKEKRTHFKEKSKQETVSLLQRADAAVLVKADARSLSRILKSATESGTLTEELEKALLERIAGKTLGVEHISLILFGSLAKNEAWMRIRSAALEYACTVIGFSNQLLHFHVQSGRLTGFRVEVKEFQNGYAARIIAALNGEERSVPRYEIGNNKKEAQHAAADHFLKCYLDGTLVPSAATQAPEETHSVPEKIPATISEEILSGENYVGLLGEACLKRTSRSMPIYEFIQSGPSHAPNITCTCSLTIGSDILQTTSSAANKKIAKQIAAKMMMEKIMNLTDTDAVPEGGEQAVEPADESIDENYVGILIETCAEKKLPLPEFLFSHAGPSHQLTFTCIVHVHTPHGVLSASGVARQKKNAKQIAAREILKRGL
jgi:ribonuclease R